MKKTICLMLSLLMLLSLMVTALADGTTTLTTTVPSATYTLNIPADQVIEFGKETSNIGNVTVTNASGFGIEKDLEVAVSYDGYFKSESLSTTIPYTIQAYYSVWNPNYSRNEPFYMSADKLTFKGSGSGSVAQRASTPKTEETVQYLCVFINNSSWSKALGGEYSTTITFTSEVVSVAN